MTDTNGLRLTAVRETTIGTTPGSPRMRTLRVTGEGLRAELTYENSEEIRDDRMEADPVPIGLVSDGTINMELSFPPDRSVLYDLLASGFYNNWRRMPQHYNDGTADSSITAITAATGTFTVVNESGSGGFSGADYRARMLIYVSGLEVSDRLLIVTSSTATTVVVGAGTGINDEAVPGAEARLKVVGFIAPSGDMATTATGLATTVLDFTVMGLAVGQWIKIDATGGAFSFATAALNTWVRITAIGTQTLTLDHLPAGWVVDAGTGKTIRIFAGDYLRNGTTELSQTYERGFMRQGTPSYIVQPGMHVGQLQFTLASRAKVTMQATFQGMTFPADSTTSLDASPDPSPDVAAYPIFACGANCGKVMEAGSRLTAPNWVNSMTITLNNNPRPKNAIDDLGPVGVGAGTASVSGSLVTYFGSLALRSKAQTGITTSIATPLVKGTRGLMFTQPRLTVQGSPNNPARNQDVMLNLTSTASRDPLTAAHLQLDRLEFVQ